MMPADDDFGDDDIDDDDDDDDKNTDERVNGIDIGGGETKK